MLRGPQPLEPAGEDEGQAEEDDERDDEGPVSRPDAPGGPLGSAGERVGQLGRARPAALGITLEAAQDGALPGAREVGAQATRRGAAAPGAA